MINAETDLAKDNCFFQAGRPADISIVVMKKLKYTPHPYAIYIPTPGFKGFSQFGKCQFNNMGFATGVDTETEKRKKRVICIGGSAVELAYGDNVENTLPGWIGILLGDDYEVINAGCCGHTTAEMLIRFEFRLIDLSPDFLVVYEMFNDVLYGGLASGFASDYSHVRKNDGLSGDSRCLTDRINKEIFPVDYIPDQAVQAYKRNLRNICSIALANKIKPILVSYQLNPGLWDSEHIYPLDDMHLSSGRNAFKDGLKRYSKIPRELSEENGEISFIEPEPLIDRDFIDTCHLKTSGMKKIGKAVSDFIKQR